jgi:hypothetical protein
MGLGARLLSTSVHGDRSERDDQPQGRHDGAAAISLSHARVLSPPKQLHRLPYRFATRTVSIRTAVNQSPKGTQYHLGPASRRSAPRTSPQCRLPRTSTPDRGPPADGHSGGPTFLGARPWGIPPAVREYPINRPIWRVGPSLLRAAQRSGHRRLNTVPLGQLHEMTTNFRYVDIARTTASPPSGLAASRTCRRPQRALDR